MRAAIGRSLILCGEGLHFVSVAGSTVLVSRSGSSQIHPSSRSTTRSLKVSTTSTPPRLLLYFRLTFSNIPFLVEACVCTRFLCYGLSTVSEDRISFFANEMCEFGGSLSVSIVSNLPPLTCDTSPQ
jgi:hypothetical protein